MIVIAHPPEEAWETLPGGEMVMGRMPLYRRVVVADYCWMERGSIPQREAHPP